MRIAQIVDSLEIGGAERMAVNYANALSSKIELSCLVVTRKEGNLKNQLLKNVSYLFLNKKNTFDCSSVLRLRNFCKTNKIDILHSHSTSYFIAVLVKITYPKIKIIWHDHNGLSEYVYTKTWYPLKLASFFFSGIIAVNNNLQIWAKRKLFCENVIYIMNFTQKQVNESKSTVLNGVKGKMILLLANLRAQKDHILLLDVAEVIIKDHADWTFHLVGKDFGDEYSGTIKSRIETSKLSQSVFLYGGKDDISYIISQAEIALITSKSEGLPVALLEYGLHAKPVVVTAVGEIPTVIENDKNGIIVPAGNSRLFASALSGLISSKALRFNYGQALKVTVGEMYSETAAVRKYLNWLTKIV